MDPVCFSIFTGIKDVAARLKQQLGALDADLNEAFKAVTSAYVSDSRWPPAPTSPGRFNVRESIDDMYTANEAIRRAMLKHGIANLRALYSPELMNSQIRAIETKLMAFNYFGE
jgi:hypothetical protein